MQNDRGLLFGGLVSTPDIVPTALDYSGALVPERIDGQRLRPSVELNHDIRSGREMP